MKQGKLYLNEIGRYAIDEYTELRSGDIVEISLNGNEWIKTAIEHADCYGGYYGDHKSRHVAKRAILPQIRGDYDRISK